MDLDFLTSSVSLFEHLTSSCTMKARLEKHLTLSLHLYEVPQRQSHGLGVQAAEGLSGCGSGDGLSVLLGVVGHFCWILGSWQPTDAHHLNQERQLF